MKKGFLFLAVMLAPGLGFCEELLKEGLPNIKSELVNMPSFGTLAEELGPAVVNISGESDVRKNLNGQGQELIIPGMPPLQLRPDMAMPVKSLGSGFIVDESGYIVTNNHVVEKADKVIVTLMNDKTEYPAKVVGRDAKTDLALLKIEPKSKLRFVYMGDSENLRVGDWVIAIGNPFQLGQTVTAGIVSAKSRKVQTGGPYDDFIQTDASINPGNSGGPLFNVHGQVVGINTAIFSPGRSQSGGTGFNIGIGFATPINLAKSVIKQIREHGKVTRGWLGVLIQKITPEVADALGLKEVTGALVADVMSNSPAELAGIRRRDVILKFNSKEIKENDDLPLVVANTPIGETAQVELLRDGKKIVVPAKIQELKDEDIKKVAPEPEPNNLGLSVEDLNEETIKALNLKSKDGVLVRGVEPGSIAEQAGFDRGDVIREFAGVEVKDLDSFQRAVKALRKDRAALVLVQRAVGTIYLTLKFN